MENKKLKNLSVVALMVSVLPLATLLPAFLKITLSEGVCSIWAGVNIVSVLVGVILSMICVWSKESRSAVNIVSTVVSVFWLLLMAGIVALAFILSSLGLDF